MAACRPCSRSGGMSANSLTVRVARKSAETAEICSFELSAPDGGELPPFTAGAHIDVHLPGGITRQYSRCNEPSQRGRYRIVVLRDPASTCGSRAKHDDGGEGNQLQSGMPSTLLAQDASAPRHNRMAGEPPRGGQGKPVAVRV